jgi:hypothetical protein
MAAGFLVIKIFGRKRCLGSIWVNGGMVSVVHIGEEVHDSFEVLLAHGHRHSQAALNLSNRLPFFPYPDDIFFACVSPII